MPMKNPPHPGESVHYDCIEACGLSIAEAATHLGVNEHELTEVCEARAPVTADLAIRLDLAFGGGARIWLALQADYDLAQARQRAGDLRITRVPVPELEQVVGD